MKKEETCDRPSIRELKEALKEQSVVPTEPREICEIDPGTAAAYLFSTLLTRHKTVRLRLWQVRDFMRRVEAEVLRRNAEPRLKTAPEDFWKAFEDSLDFRFVGEGELMEVEMRHSDICGMVERAGASIESSILLASYISAADAVTHLT